MSFYIDAHGNGDTPVHHPPNNRTNSTLATPASVVPEVISNNNARSVSPTAPGITPISNANPESNTGPDFHIGGPVSLQNSSSMNEIITSQIPLPQSPLPNTNDG